MWDYQLQSVKLSKIDLSDEAFRISSRCISPALMDSLRSVGVLHAPWIIQRQDKYQPIAGFKRLKVLLDLGGEKIDARVLGPATSDQECAFLAILDNTTQRQLTPVETGRAFQLIKKKLMFQEKLASVARKLGLPANLDFLEKTQKASQLPEYLQTGIEKETIALSSAFQLERLSEKAAEIIAGWFTNLRPSLNKQREIVTLLTEIAKRESVAMESLLQDPFFKRFDGVIKDRGQSLGDLRRYLHQRRYPVISQYEAVFHKWSRTLGLGAGLRVTAPPNLESNDYLLAIRFQDSKSLFARLENVRQKITPDAWNKLQEKLNKITTDGTYSGQTDGQLYRHHLKSANHAD